MWPFTTSFSVESICDNDDPVRSLRKRNIALVKGAVGRVGWDLAERLVKEGDPGNNLLHLISENGETDFGLVRSALSPRVVSIAAAYFEKVAGTRSFILPYMNLLVRHFDPARRRPETVIPFHQDAFGFPASFRAINCWTLLYPEECGETSPGMDFMPLALRSQIALEANPASKVYGFLETDHERLRRMARKHSPLTPSVKLGDVLMFNGWAIHRTSLRTGLVKPRVSAEIRVVAATTAVMAEMRNNGQSFAIVTNGRIRWPARWNLSSDGKFRTISEREEPLTH